MRKFARAKVDGHVLNYTPAMDPALFDTFECEGPPPEFIPDMAEFLAGKLDVSKIEKPRTKKPEPVFLKTASGELA